jgi:hypothetical protein
VGPSNNPLLQLEILFRRHFLQSIFSNSCLSKYEVK